MLWTRMVACRYERRKELMDSPSTYSGSTDKLEITRQISKTNLHEVPHKLKDCNSGLIIATL